MMDTTMIREAQATILLKFEQNRTLCYFSPQEHQSVFGCEYVVCLDKVLEVKKTVELWTTFSYDRKFVHSFALLENNSPVVSLCCSLSV